MADGRGQKGTTEGRGQRAGAKKELIFTHFLKKLGRQ